MTDILRELQDERDIQRGLCRFARILDAKEFSALGDVFAHDLTYNYGEGEQSGIESLEALVRRRLSICGNTQHLLGSIQIEVSGDRAFSRAYVQARHEHIGAFNGPILDTNGEYCDQWERRPEGWRIVRRDAHWLIFHGEPAIVALELPSSAE